jgi:MarR family transcriptional regulator, negative regulator of the multidrug operon emrRAB
MHDVARSANLLGAAALAVTDLMRTAITSAAGVSASGAAALVVLHHSPGITVTELGRRVGLSQPAATRMVDALRAGGLVERTAGGGRTVAVSLTDSGRQAVVRLLHARAEPLRRLVNALDPVQRAVLDDLLDVLLAQLYQSVRSEQLLCRLCDRASCVREAHCPVGVASRS